MSERTYGHIKSGKPITEEMIEELASEAEQGYEPGQLRGRRRGPGRPPLGDAAKSIESVRLEPALRSQAAKRAAVEGITVSEVIRRALREYLQNAWTCAPAAVALADPQSAASPAARTTRCVEPGEQLLAGSWSPRPATSWAWHAAYNPG